MQKPTGITPPKYQEYYILVDFIYSFIDRNLKNKTFFSSLQQTKRLSLNSDNKVKNKYVCFFDDIRVAIFTVVHDDKRIKQKKYFEQILEKELLDLLSSLITQGIITVLKDKSLIKMSKDEILDKLRNIFTENFDDFIYKNTNFIENINLKNKSFVTYALKSDLLRITNKKPSIINTKKCPINKNNFTNDFNLFIPKNNIITNSLVACP